MNITLTREQEIKVLADILTKEQVSTIGGLILKDYDNVEEKDKKTYREIFEILTDVHHAQKKKAQ